MTTGYSDTHAESVVDAVLSDIATWQNQYTKSGYTVEMECPEFTSICPKTGLPDFGTLVVRYQPAERCLELKSFKLYLLEYRNLPIFQENAVNKVLDAAVAVADPVWASVEGRFEPRGGHVTCIVAKHRRQEPS